MVIRWLGLMLLLWGTSACAQSAQPGSQQTTEPSTATQIPLSGREGQAGSVAPSQSTTNAGGGNTVNLINSSVNVQGSFQGSVPTGTNTGTVLPITLEDALRRGLQNNLGAVTESQSAAQMSARQHIARSALLPNATSVITEAVQQLNLRTQGVEQSSFPLAAGPFNYFDARAARVTQTVFDLVRIRNLHSAGELTKAAVESARDGRDLIVLAVAGAYLQIIATNARISAARAQVESSQAIFEQAKDRLQAGLDARIDETRSRVQFQTDQQRLRSLLADFDNQKLNLSRLIGLPIGQDFRVADDFPYASVNDVTQQSALEEAYRNRADLKAAESSVLAAQQAVKAAHAERLPSLSLTADYGAAGLRPTAEAHGVFSVAGTLTIPLYLGGRTGADVAEANAILNQRRAELADTRARIDQDVRQAFIYLNAAADQVGVAQSNVELAEDTLNQARDRFIAGVADTVEVVLGQQTVAQAHNDYISAVFEHNLAKVSLARAMGDAEQRIKQFLRAH